MLWRQYWRHFWGSFFNGAYLPQKLDLSPPIERQYKPFQKHVSSYQVKISEGYFVCGNGLCLYARTYLIMEEQPFKYSE
jgi:hypothetical protein